MQGRAGVCLHRNRHLCAPLARAFEVRRLLVPEPPTRTVIRECTWLNKVISLLVTSRHCLPSHWAQDLMANMLSYSRTTSSISQLPVVSPTRPRPTQPTTRDTSGVLAARRISQIAKPHHRFGQVFQIPLLEVFRTNTR